MIPSKKARQVWRGALQRDALNQKLQQAYLSILKDPEEAGRVQRRFALLNHGEFRAALDELDEGNYAAAIRDFAKILEAHPELDEVRRRMAFAVFVNKQYPDAAREYESLAGNHPDEPDLRLTLSVPFRQNSLLERASRTLDQLIRTD